MAKPRTCIPNKLKSYRKLRGYSQKDVATILGHKRTNRICKWEKGTAIPGHANMLMLCRLFRTIPAELFCDWNALLMAKVDTAEKELLAQRGKPQYPDSS